MTMDLSLLPWLLAAVLVAWAVGAHNRLVRLRAAIHTAFAAVEAELAPLVKLADTLEPDDDEEDDEPPPEFVEPIRGASAQLAASLASAKARPLDGDRIAALRAAGEAWAQAWDRAEREDAHDLAGPRLPEAMSTTRAVRLAQAEAAGRQFNEAIDRYNRAIAQFPALILAWVFGFRPARPL